MYDPLPPSPSDDPNSPYLSPALTILSDTKVEPILEVLVGKTLELSVLELMEVRFAIVL